MDEAVRQYPVPGGPHVMHMRWSELLFAHWPVDPDALAAMLPAGLTVETWDGVAWVGVVPFLMSRVRPVMLPPVPGTSRFPELNVRTYVRPAAPASAEEDRPGVYFFSLDAANRLAVRAARTFFHLRYRDADMACGRDEDGWVQFRSRRTERRFPAAELTVRYRGREAMSPVRPDSHEDFLSTRYCLYAVDGAGGVHRGEIDHPPWRLAAAEAEFEGNTMLASHGIEPLRAEPLLHVADAVDVRAWLNRRVRSQTEKVA
jgi:uncharacterized protein YqjF (DUF2071 family)